MAFEALNNLGHYKESRNHPQRQWSFLCAYCEQVATVMSRVRQSPNYVKGRQAVVNIPDRMPLARRLSAVYPERLLPCGKCGNPCVLERWVFGT